VDEERLMKKVNLIVATTNNMGPICMSVRNAAEELIHGGKADDGLLSAVEMFFRAYDPCFACASHTTGQSPLEVNIRNADGSLHKRLSNFD
jgi:F420-non-reducing hydrogenase large subunit